jgi:hypothetical protein
LIKSTLKHDILLFQPNFDYGDFGDFRLKSVIY